MPLKQVMVVKINSDKVTLVSYTLNMIQEGHSHPWLFFPKTYNLDLAMRKVSYNPKLRNILQNTWPVLYKIFKVMGNKKRLRKQRSLRRLCD